jgi:hypothetical protein
MSFPLSFEDVVRWLKPEVQTQARLVSRLESELAIETKQLAWQIEKQYGIRVGDDVLPALKRKFDPDDDIEGCCFLFLHCSLINFVLCSCEWHNKPRFRFGKVDVRHAAADTSRSTAFC